MWYELKADFSALNKYIESYENNAEKAIKATLNDFKRRAPSWIAAEVVKEYTIKKNEIVQSKSTKRTAGISNVQGNTIDTAVIIYKGRPLTPLHFSVTPKVSKGLTDKKALINANGLDIAGGRKPEAAYSRMPKKYKIKMAVKKGKQEQLVGKYDTPPFMAPVKKGSTTQIPFQRKADSKEIVAFRSVSLPQMVQNETVAEGIQKEINDKLRKRFEHHVERFMR